MTLKLNIGKPAKPKSLADTLSNKPVEAPKPKMALTIGTPKPLSVTRSPIAGQSSLSIPSNDILQVSPAVDASLKPAIDASEEDFSEIANQMPVNTIPVVTAEKYQLLADACNTLSAETIEEFNSRMQYVVSSMNNPELGDAMKRVLEYTQEHNELQPFLREDDIALFVRGARKSYARVAEKKTKNRSKKKANIELDASAIDDLLDLDILI